MKKNTVQEIEQLKKSFEYFNINRIYTAMNNFSEEKTGLFNLIPLLIHTNFTDLNNLPLPVTAPAGISSFTPSVWHVTALEKCFPNAQPATPSANTIAPIESLALVGSTGTIAQTETSDLDYVLFLYKENLSDKQLNDLNEKLCLIELWTMQKFNTETHFFVSDIHEFHENRFGLTDKEQVGSALGKLFKDEFYRTAIFVAGKRPLWWLTPNHLDDDNITDFLKYLSFLKSIKIDDYLDLGHITHIDFQDYFGAALWQINKAFNSPFKSLLKMGLLESYLINPMRGLLCDQLKDTILHKSQEQTLLDPYKMMCDWIIDFYSKMGMKKEVLLIQCAFLLKLDVVPETVDRLLRTPEKKLDEKMKSIVAIMREWNWSAADSLYMKNTFSDLLKNNYSSLGDVNNFFLNVYKRLTDCLHQSGSKSVFISAEDMTVLGRKLFTFLERRSGKIPFILQGNAPSNALPEISIINEKSDKGTRLWSLYNFHITGEKLETLKKISPPIIQMSSVFEMLVWMTINQIWNPKTKIFFENGTTAIDLTDVEQITAELHSFFVTNGIKEPEREDYISDKRIIKIFILPNFGLEKPSGYIEKVNMIFLSSWGVFEHIHMRPKEAFKIIADLKTQSEKLHKLLSVKIVSPDSQNDPRLVLEFEQGVTQTKLAKDIALTRSKKARLDI